MIRALIVMFASRIVAGLSIRGQHLVFVSSNHTHEGRRLASNDAIWYVQSGSVPPPNCVAPEAVGPGIYLARGEASASYPRGEWTPQMKYDPNMNFLMRGKTFEAEIRSDHSSLSFTGCDVVKIHKHRFVARCNRDAKLDIANDPRVLWFAPRDRIKLHHFTMPNMNQWNGTGSRIAVTDTGLDYKHCGFTESYVAPPLGSISNTRNKIVGILKVPNADFNALLGAHGTATAGVAAGYACFSRSGIATDAQIVFVDNSPNDDVILIPQEMESVLASSNFTIHSASWGPMYGTGAYENLDSRFDVMARENVYACHVRSAGNDGPLGIVGATSKNTMVVGACLSRAEDYTDMSSAQRAQQPELYSHTSQIDFSSRGPAADGRLFPQVCAPGFRVWAPYALDPSTWNHASYSKASGTSFSAPAIAGIMARLQQKFKSENDGKKPTCALIEAMLMAHAKPPTRVVKQTDSTLSVLSNAPPITTLGTPIFNVSLWTDVEDSISNQRRAFCFESLINEPWTVVMRWTDVASVAGSSNPLINDLDMVLIGAHGDFRVEDDAINNFEIAKSWPAQHTRIVAFAELVTFTAQPFAMHIRASTRRVNCSSTALPWEYSSCGQGMVRYVDSWKGTTTCDYRQCPGATWCGADCARTCDPTRACVIPNGEGRMDESDACRPISCAQHFFVTDAACVCKSAKTCENGRIVKCINGAFESCESEFDSRVASSAVALKAWYIFLFMLFMIIV